MPIWRKYCGTNNREKKLMFVSRKCPFSDRTNSENVTIYQNHNLNINYHLWERSEIKMKCKKNPYKGKQIGSNINSALQQECSTCKYRWKTSFGSAFMMNMVAMSFWWGMTHLTADRKNSSLRPKSLLKEGTKLKMVKDINEIKLAATRQTEAFTSSFIHILYQHICAEWVKSTSTKLNIGIVTVNKCSWGIPTVQRRDSLFSWPVNVCKNLWTAEPNITEFFEDLGAES